MVLLEDKAGNRKIEIRGREMKKSKLKNIGECLIAVFFAPFMLFAPMALMIAFASLLALIAQINPGYVIPKIFMLFPWFVVIVTFGIWLGFVFVCIDNIINKKGKRK